MLKFNRKFKKLVIPVGINPSFGNDTSTLYNVSDADVVANDVIAGKIAYGADGKIVGTLDVESEKEESYNEGIKDQKAKLETITITENGTYNREDGYNEVIVEVPDLNGDYNEGYSDGVVAGREEIISGMSDATITPQTVFKGEIGYGANNEKIVGEYEYVEGFDFGVIGYSQTESNEVNRSISDDIAYSKQLYDAWDPNRTSAVGYFQNNKSLVYAPLFNTSNVTKMSYMFAGCSNLTTVPLLDTSNVTNMKSMFSACYNLKSIPEFDTSNVSSMYSMFQSCYKLTSIPEFDTSNVISMRNMFSECTNITSIPEMYAGKVSEIAYFCEYYSTIMKLVNFGGLVDLGKGFSNEKAENERVLNLSTCAHLTYESCMNIINKVYDMNLTDITDAKIKFHSTPYALLSADDIAIATNKGWTIQ